MINSMEKNNNKHNLEVGKSYWFKYIHCESEWFKGTITRITDMGFPWCDTAGGIISPDGYEIADCTPEKELEELAREFLIKKDCKGFANNSAFPKWMSEFFNEVSPEFKVIIK